MCRGFPHSTAVQSRAAHGTSIEPRCSLGRVVEKQAPDGACRGARGVGPACSTPRVWSFSPANELDLLSHLLATNAANDGSANGNCFSIFITASKEITFLLPVMLVADLAPEPSENVPAAGTNPFELETAGDRQHQESQNQECSQLARIAVWHHCGQKFSHEFETLTHWDCRSELQLDAQVLHAAVALDAVAGAAQKLEISDSPSCSSRRPPRC